MPLGVANHSLNLANPSAPPAGVTYDSWTSSVATDVGVTNAIMGMWPLNDTTMICANRAAGTLAGSIITRSGTTLTVALANTTSSLTSFFGAAETTPAGFVVDSTNSVGYAWGNTRRIAKFYNITSSGLSISGNALTPTSTLITQPVAMRVLSNGTLRLWGELNSSLYRHDYVIAGTTTISFSSQTTNTISGITGSVKAVSVVSDDQVLVITLSGSTVYAYTVTGTTATQIGSTISAGSYTTYPSTAGSWNQQDQQGNRVSWTSYQTGVGWKVYTATTAGFTSYNVTGIPSGGRGTTANNNAYSVTIGNHVQDTDNTFFMNRYAEHQVWRTRNDTSVFGAGISIFGNTDVHRIRNWGNYLSVCGNSTRLTILIP
jgi:hypothetical protein